MRFAPPSTGDLIAGVSVALVVIPQSLAYAELAGLPAQYGLFAAALPSLLAAAFVSSPYLQTGPGALTALLTFGALESLARPQSTDYIELAALLAVMVGVIRMTLGLLRLGGVAYLLSDPVMLGFTSGAAVLIVSSQLPKVFDVAPAGDGILQDAFHVLVNPGDWHWEALAFSALTLVAVFGGRRVHRFFPGVLLAVAAGVIISIGLGYDGSTIGELGGGFIPIGFEFPTGSVGDLAIPAFVIALVGFAEPASIARSFAAEERMTWNANREMFGQGIANLASGISGAFPVGGSFARSSLNRMAGATSPWAGAITGGFVLVALPFTPLLEELPRAVLGAIVVGAVFKLAKLGELYHLVTQNRLQAFVGIGTFVATLLSAPRVERGVLVGIGLALAAHLYREMSVSTESVLDGDKLTVSPQGVLWFASIPQIERLIRSELAAQPDIDHVVIDLGAVGRLDYSGAAALGRIIEELRRAEVIVDVTNVKPGSARGVRIHLPDAGESPPD